MSNAQDLTQAVRDFQAKKAANRVAYRFLYARLFKAMSLSEAKAVLGFPPDASPSPDEIKRVYRQKSFENHPDRGGDPKKMVEINVAKDVLEGRSQPTYEPSTGGYGGGGGWGAPPPTQTRWEPPAPEEEVTFEEAKSQGGVPGNVDWLFVTDYHSSGYSSDEFLNRATGWVAVGQTDKEWVFAAVEHYMREDYVVGTRRGKIDRYKITTHKVPKGQPITARFFYGEVVKAWKRFEELEKKFNSKVIPAEGWAFKSTPPNGRSLSIKNFLFNSGMMSEEEAAAPRKYKIDVINRGLPFDKRNNPPSDYYTPKYGDPLKLILVINGKEYDLSKQATEKLYRLRVKGKDFMKWMFGEYYYGGEVKVLTLKREGKEVMAWMADNLPGLAPWVVEALKAASVQTSGGSSRRRR